MSLKISKMMISIVVVALLAVMAVLYSAGDESKVPETIENVEPSKSVQQDAPRDQESTERSDEAKAIFVPLHAVKDSDVLLDASANSSTHIAGSAVIPYTEFDMQAGVLKTVPEIAKILGDAGISREDSVVVYGECLPCGGGPSVATYVYWIMKSLSHENVTVLNGTVEDWAASGRSTTKVARMLPGKIYVPEERADFTATYDYVKSGQAQVVDARTPKEFEYGSIPGSISIPYDSVLNGKKLKDKDQLNEVFTVLEKDRPVVVFTQTGMKGSVVWFALKMMDYDAKLYSYKDWMANQELKGDARN